MLTAKAILEADDIKIEKVSTPEWGGHVHVRTMSNEQRDAFEEACREAKAAAGLVVGFRARLARWTICDDKGELLFVDTDIVRLRTKNATAMDRTTDVAIRLNPMGDKDVEELAGKSKRARKGASGSR